MSSLFSRLLHGFFFKIPKSESTTTFTIPKISATTPIPKTTVETPKPKPTTSFTPKISPPSPTISAALDPEKPLKVYDLVKRFKKISDNENFRRKSSNYEATVQRLINGNYFLAIENILEHQRKYKESFKDESFAVRIISLYGKAKMFKHARKLFHDLPTLGCNYTVISFNALLYACVYSEKYDEIINLLKDKPVSIKLDTESYNIIIKAFCEMGDFNSAITLLNEFEKSGLNPDFITYYTILDAYYKRNKCSEAENFWCLIKDKNVVIYNTKLQYLVYKNRVLEAVDLMKEMEEKEVKLNLLSYNTMIKGFVRNEKLEEAKKMYEKINENYLIPDYITFFMLIPFVRDKGDLSYAIGLCKRVIELEIYYSVIEIQKLVDGLIVESRVEEAKELVELVNSSRMYRDKDKLKMPLL